MMNRQLTALALSLAALLGTGTTQANLLHFDDPAPVLLDDAGTLASYTEDGFVLQGSPASFLPLDARLLGGIDGPATLNLKAAGGGSFALASLDYAFFDLGFGEPPGLLTVVGLLNGVPVAVQALPLGAAATTSFGVSFGLLTEVTFSASTGYTLDNVMTLPAVPEPGTGVLAGAGLLLLAMARARRNRGSRYGAMRWSARSPSQAASSNNASSDR